MIKVTNLRFKGEQTKGVVKKEVFFEDDLVCLYLYDDTMVSGRCIGITGSTICIQTPIGDISVDVGNIKNFTVGQLGSLGCLYALGKK